MKKERLYFLSLILTFTLILVFSCNIFAAETKDYANEEGADSGWISPLSISPSATPVTDGNLIVVLDPGHGGSDGGAANGSVNEKTINLKVAQYCKTYLEQHYTNVTVYLTRSDSNTYYDLDKRAEIAAGYGADLMISLHFNANDSASASGGEVYVSRLEEYALTNLGTQIVNNLAALGISKRGVYTRASATTPPTLWIDGIRTADYYGIIKHPAEYEIPSMIVEHCFLSNASDYANYISSDAKLKNLGEADAQAIAAYFNLGENISSTTLENARYTATNTLNAYYNSLTLSAYSTTFQTKIQNIYQDALSRINLATGTGKINLTLNRATKTMAYYPTAIANFSDVKALDWYKNAVVYGVANDLFKGTTSSTFSPGDTITRGQFITVIGRNSGVNGTTPANTVFGDVNRNDYYAPYIAWASQNEIVNGLSPTVYGPNQSITREDLVTILYRYAEKQNITLTETTGKTTANFSDDASIDSWATAAMNWAVEHGIINGDDQGKLNPRSYTTRAEAAQIMMTFTKQS